MKQAVKDALKEKGLPNYGPNRKQGKAQPLCDCGDNKKSHYMNGKGHPYRGNPNTPNNLWVTAEKA
jgi:hypothetical protein